MCVPVFVGDETYLGPGRAKRKSRSSRRFSRGFVFETLQLRELKVRLCTGCARLMQAWFCRGLCTVVQWGVASQNCNNCDLRCRLHEAVCAKYPPTVSTKRASVIKNNRPVTRRGLVMAWVGRDGRAPGRNCGYSPAKPPVRNHQPPGSVCIQTGARADKIADDGLSAIMSGSEAQIPAHMRCRAASAVFQKSRGMR